MALVERNWQTLMKASKMNINYVSADLREAEIILDPLERGFGMTLGTSLRRVLLSSLQGAAITALRVDGVLHEYSAISGVKEDMVEVILNLKKLSVKLNSDLPKRMRLVCSKPGIVYARDIECPSEIEILDPDHEICTLDSGGKISMEFIVQSGKGYVPASQHNYEEKPIGLIPIDAIFSPVRRVVFRVQPTRVGQRTDYDQLIMRIETNGSIKPDDALALAAKILKSQLEQFISFEEQDPLVPQKQAENLPFPSSLFKRVGELDLSVRATNCLLSEDILYIGDLVQKTESDMLRTPNFGRKSLNEIKEVLAQMGLGFGMSFPGWPPSNIEELAESFEDPFN